MAEEGDGLEEVAGLVVGDDGDGGGLEAGGESGVEFSMEGGAVGVAGEGEGGVGGFEVGVFEEWELGGEEALAGGDGEAGFDLADEAVVGVGFPRGEDFDELDDVAEAGGDLCGEGEGGAVGGLGGCAWVADVGAVDGEGVFAAWEAAADGVAEAAGDLDDGGLCCHGEKVFWFVFLVSVLCGGNGGGGEILCWVWIFFARKRGGQLVAAPLQIKDRGL